MKDLIPCPHCGGEADIYHGDSTDGYIKGTGYVEAFCGWCGARIRGTTDEEVVEKWNRRDYSGNSPNWIYVEDSLPPLKREVFVKVEVDNGLGPVLLTYIDWREQRTGCGRTIECWHKADKMNYTVLAWMPIPEFRRREEE